MQGAIAKDRPAATRGHDPAVRIVNGTGTGTVVLICDHASNRFPAPYDTILGLSQKDKERHIAWDPGAFGVASAMAERLDAPLVYSTVSRLVIDCNREEDADDLIPAISETTPIPGNSHISGEERELRLGLAHRPFHAAIDALLDERQRLGRSTVLVSVHSYTPIYMGQSRPWEIGLIANTDRRLFEPALARLRAETAYQVGDNEPYSPADGVYYTLIRHGENRGLPSLMIEIRNDEIATPAAEHDWGALLAETVHEALKTAGAGGAHA
ncbi:MAG: N-formylglutamate amidohydrolase [Roseibium sp.]|nr:N-formylglutamate amidohydrolase [Roseibium sp.]